MTPRSERALRRTPVTLLAIAAMLASLLASVALADHGDPLTFQQDQFYGLTAGEIADLGISNEDDCENGENEVGWHFVAPGGEFEHAEITYSTGTQSWATDNTPGDTSKVQVAGGKVKGLYFVTSPSATLEEALAWGEASGDKFVLSHVCVPQTGFLKVQKFIDVNADGILDVGDVTGSDANLNNWLFNVYAGTTTDAANLVTQLSTGTDNDGMTDTIELGIGTYTVEEENTGETITTAVTGGSTTELTTDGDGVLDNSSTKDVVLDATTVYTFGNACLISKRFEVTNGAGLSGVFVIYDVNDPLNDGDGDHRVSLTGPDGAGAWSALVKDILRIGDEINWTFGINEGTTDEEVHPTVQTDTVPSDAGYPDCLDLNTRANTPVPVSGAKVKDMNDDGIIQSEEELAGLENFVFEIRDASGPLERAVSDTNGEYTFPSLHDAGTYTVCELGVSADGSTTVDADLTADWVQTVPAASACRTVTIALDDTAATVELFANAPLSDIGLFFIDRTGFTNVKIVCWDANTSPEAPLFTLDPSDPDYEDPTPESPVTLEDLRIADNDLTCTFEIIDP